jgi:anion-transporting  ArsA/GET3 family ATPase
VAAHLPLGSQRLVIVTGKGGVGKTAVAAALAHALAGAGRRTLAVEVGGGRLATLLGAAALTSTPARIAPRLHAAAVEPEAALGDFVESMLRVRVLARRLLRSTSFQVLAAAAPGLAEYLVLQTLGRWLDERRRGRRAWDVLVVDAPASGHSLPLLQAPRTLGALARLGPVGDGLARIESILVDPATTLVCLVALPEELAVRETIDLHCELTASGLPVAPPIVNGLPPRRFSPADEQALEAATGDHPFVRAARFALARRREAVAQVHALRRRLAVAPVLLPFLPAGAEDPTALARLEHTLATAAGLAA